MRQRSAFCIFSVATHVATQTRGAGVDSTPLHTNHSTGATRGAAIFRLGEWVDSTTKPSTGGHWSKKLRQHDIAQPDGRLTYPPLLKPPAIKMSLSDRSSLTRPRTFTTPYPCSFRGCAREEEQPVSRTKLLDIYYPLWGRLQLARERGAHYPCTRLHGRTRVTAG